MAAEITIAELIRNGTMSAEVAALLWTAVEEEVSFLTVAVPRFAGKSTTTNALLALRRQETPIHIVEGEPEEMARLRRDRLGGYLVVAEFSDAPVPGYIWGEPVRRVFQTLDAGYSLQACLHAPSPAAAIAEVTRGNGVSDQAASNVGLVVYLELFGANPSDFWRRVSEVYEVDRVEGGRPVGRALYRWTAQNDRFEAVEEPRNFAGDREALRSRAELLGDLARSGRVSMDHVQAAISRFRESRQ